MDLELVPGPLGEDGAARDGDPVTSSLRLSLLFELTPIVTKPPLPVAGRGRRRVALVGALRRFTRA
jgi:hypothetical protein